jgi:hypothetical protein
MLLYATLTGLHPRDARELLATGRVDLLAKNASRLSVRNAYTVLRTFGVAPRAAWYRAVRMQRQLWEE